MTWQRIVRRHLALAGRIYRPDQIAELARLSGIALHPDGTNSAQHAEDVRRYLSAVRSVCGELAYASAKLQCVVAAREHGLAYQIIEPAPG